MADENLDLKLNVDVAVRDLEQAKALRREMELLDQEILSLARDLKALVNPLSSLGRGRSRMGDDAAKAGREALGAENDLYAALKKRFTFERRMQAQRTREESDAAKRVREEQAETARQFREQMAFNTRMAKQRAQAEAEAERETRRELLETSRMRDREHKKALADAKALERAQAKAAAGAARGAGQVRSGVGRAVVVGGATAGVVGYGAKRGLDRLTRSGVDIDTAMAKNARLETGLSPEQARAKIEGVRQNYQVLARRLGVSVAELLNTRSESLQAGVDQSIVDKVVEDATKYAILNDMKPSEVAESSGYGLTALSAFGKVDAVRASRLFNMQQHLAQTTSASRQGLASFVRRGLASGASAGFSDSDTLAFGAAGTSAGQDGESVARMLSSTTERIASMPTRAADIARKKHKTIRDRQILALPRKLGFRDWKDLKARFSADGAGTMEQLYEGLSQIQDPRERLETSEEIFGKEFGSAHSAMAAGHLFKQMRQSVRSGDAGTALDRGMSIMDGAFGQIMRQIGVTISELTNDLGLELKPYWSDLRDWALRTPMAFKSFTEAFRAGLKGFVTGLGSPDGTMAGLLRRWFGDPSGFAVNASMVGGFAQGVGQGIRDIGNAIVGFVRIFAGSNASPQELGRWTARLLGLSAALLVAAPAVAVLTGLGTAIAGFAGIVMSTWGLMKAAGLVGAAAGTPKTPVGPGAAASAGWLARFGSLLKMFGGAVGFNATAGLSKGDQNALVGRLGAYAAELEKNRKAGGASGSWDAPEIAKPVEQLQEQLQNNTEALREGAKVQRQSFEAIEDFRSLIHPASLGNAARSIGDSIRANAARAGGSALSGSVGNGSLIGSSVPGGSIGNGMTGMRRRGIMGGGAGAGGGGVGQVGGSGVTNPRLAGDVAARAKEAHDFFWSQGYSEEATAGILASLSKESNFTPNARGDGGAAHGIAQWHADRRRQIMAGTGIDVSRASFSDQLRAVAWEMKSGDAGAQRAHRLLMTPGISARDAGGAFVQNFERPKRDERAERGALAEGFYRQFGGGSSGGSPLAGLGGTSKAVDNARSLLGMGSRQAAAALGSKMTAGNWCADFVNGALKSANIKGIQGSIANSYLGWGTAVADGVKAGDVVVTHRGRGVGQTGGHVGLATGQTRMKNGRLQYETISGNHGKVVGQGWEWADRVAVRRAQESVEATRVAAERAGRVNLPPGASGGAAGASGPAGPGASLGSGTPGRSLGANTPIKTAPAGSGGGSAQGGGVVNNHVTVNGSRLSPDEMKNSVQRSLNDVMNRRTHDADLAWA